MHGQLEAQWLRANGWPWNNLTCSNAAQRGHLEVLQGAHANGCPETKEEDDESEDDETDDESE